MEKEKSNLNEQGYINIIDEEESKQKDIKQSNCNSCLIPIKKVKKIKKEKMKMKCGNMNIVNFCKVPLEETTLILYGDLIVETTSNIQYDLDYSVKICELFLQKKKISSVFYDKINNFIEITYSNLKSGLCDFEYVKYRLLNSQNQQNYQVAQNLISYEQNIHNINITYLRFFAENDEDLVKQIQLDFFNRQRKLLIEGMKNSLQDFYSYVGFTYIDQNELGFPLQLLQGMSEACCAIYGIDISDVIELIQRYGFIERIFLNGYQQDFKEYFTLQHIQFIQNLEYFTNLKEVMNTNILMTTADGIQIQLNIVVNQVTQIYKETIISQFFYTYSHISTDQLEKLITIRNAQSNTKSNSNYVKYLLDDNPYYKKAFQFYEDINLCKPLSQQDQFPERTCKYKILKNIQNNKQYDQQQIN